jgi:hypothetical protein
MAATLHGRRSDAYRQVTQAFAQEHQAEVRQTFWLIQGVVLDAPLGAVLAMAERSDVLYVEPDSAGEQLNTEPDSAGEQLNTVPDSAGQQPAPPRATVAEGRALLGSDPYREQGLFQTWVALLGDGVRATHHLLSNPPRSGLRFDCTSDPCTALGAAETFCTDHGTASAAVLSANERLGPAYSGVTTALVDSYQVYARDCSGLQVSAVVRGFEQALLQLDRVVVASLYSGSGPGGAASRAATQAVAAGAVVVAPVGDAANFPGQVAAPANALNVISVAGVDLRTGEVAGPTPETVGQKPDIFAPTGVETAGAAADTDVRGFAGNGAAAAFAGGAAALLRNWLRVDSATIDPGQVNVWLVLAGVDGRPAGSLQLPTSGRIWWGKVQLDGAVTIPLDLGGGETGEGYTSLAAALWWPVETGAPSSAAGLTLVAPDGTAHASPASAGNLARLRVAGPPATGVWTLRIERQVAVTSEVTATSGQSNMSGLVYWAIYATAPSAGVPDP